MRRAEVKFGGDIISCRETEGSSLEIVYNSRKTPSVENGNII